MSGVKILTPSRFHAPPLPLGASQSATGLPPICTFFSFAIAKKPIDLLSGDQNGKFPSSVPANFSAVVESSARKYSAVTPPCEAEKTTCLESGDTANPPFVGPNVPNCSSPPVLISARTERCCAGFLISSPTASANAASVATAATAHGSHAFFAATASGPVAALTPLSAAPTVIGVASPAHFSCSFTSCTL